MVENQAYLFLVFSLTGVIIGILFDIFRSLRKCFKTSDIITYIEDVLFWVLTGIIILYSIWYFNNGEIRLFMFIGIIMGVLIYVLTLSNILSKIIYTILNVTIKPITKIFTKISNIIYKNIIKIVEKRKKYYKIKNKTRELIKKWRILYICRIFYIIKENMESTYEEKEIFKEHIINCFYDMDNNVYKATN